MARKKSLPPENQQSNPEKDESLTAKLLTEYQANIDIWKHTDNIRLQRNSLFLNLNTLLLVALGTFVTISPSVLVTAIVASLISLFGFPVCIIWRSVQNRNSEYLRFRFYQLRSIEAQLGDINSITNQWKALKENKTVTFKGMKDEFTVRSSAKGSSAISEERLPSLIAFFWALIFFGSITVASLNYLGII